MSGWGLTITHMFLEYYNLKYDKNDIMIRMMGKQLLPISF